MAVAKAIKMAAAFNGDLDNQETKSRYLKRVMMKQGESNP
jgi:hypothetical protein